MEERGKFKPPSPYLTLVFAPNNGYIFSMGSVATGSAKLGKLEKFAPTSKFIASVEYDSVGKTLDLTFTSGSKYRYIDVTPVTFLSFKQSPTIDAFYARAIKGNLQSVKLIDQGIGREKSAPLDRVRKEHDLDTGTRKQESIRKQIAGTVNRAFQPAVATQE